MNITLMAKIVADEDRIGTDAHDATFRIVQGHRASRRTISDLNLAYSVDWKSHNTDLLR